MKKRLLAVIISAMIISTSMLAGCGCENKTATTDEAPTTVPEMHEVSDTSSPSATEATLSKEEQAIVNSGLKVDDKGNVVDKNGKKVEIKDGKVEIKTEDGKTVTVNASEVTVANKNNNKINTSNSSKSNSTSSKSSSTGSSSSKNSSSNKVNNSSSKSSSTSSKSSSSSSSGKPNSSNKQENSKTWHEAVYKTVNHPAETKKVNHPAKTHEEPVYEMKEIAICWGCGERVDSEVMSNTERIAHMKQHTLNGEDTGYHNDYIQVQIGKKTVVDKEAWTETVVVKEAWTEKVLVKEAGYY